HSFENSGYFQNYDQSDGLLGDEFNRGAVFQNNEGMLFFGGTNGFNYFFPEEVIKNPHPPQIQFTGFKLFNKEVPIGQKGTPLPQHINTLSEITLNHRQTVFSIEFIALNLSHSEKNQYAYQLVGLEDDWNYVGNLHSATYTNLDAGTYTFRVKAANHDGVWNEEGISLRIIVLPPWWETTWFRILVLITLLIGLWAFFRYRTQQFRKQQKVLEKKVAERTQELQAKNEEITSQFDLLSEKNKEIQAQTEELFQLTEELSTQRDHLMVANGEMEKQQSEIKSQNRRIKHSIRAAQTIQQAILPLPEKQKEILKEFFVIDRPKDVVSGDFYWLEKTYNRLKLLAVVDCTGHGVPGAFMTLIGTTLLDKIVNSQGVADPAHILHLLHQEVREVLKQEHNGNNFGMDMGIVTWKQREDQQYEVAYSGAKNSMYYAL
ncbi:MAG: triple tyrosine motif-containing protein, partial [Bacteroidota bacterium]